METKVSQSRPGCCHSKITVEEETEEERSIWERKNERKKKSKPKQNTHTHNPEGGGSKRENKEKQPRIGKQERDRSLCNQYISPASSLCCNHRTCSVLRFASCSGIGPGKRGTRHGIEHSRTYRNRLKKNRGRRARTEDERPPAVVKHTEGDRRVRSTLKISHLNTLDGRCVASSGKSICSPRPPGQDGTSPSRYSSLLFCYQESTDRLRRAFRFACCPPEG